MLLFLISIKFCLAAGYWLLALGRFHYESKAFLLLKLPEASGQRPEAYSVFLAPTLKSKLALVPLIS